MGPHRVTQHVLERLAISRHEVWSTLHRYADLVLVPSHDFFLGLVYRLCLYHRAGEEVSTAPVFRNVYI